MRGTGAHTHHMGSCRLWGILLIVALTCSASSARADDGSARERLRWPISPVRIARGFDPPAHDWLAGHRGIDLDSTPGQAVLSPLAGTVRFAGEIADRPVLSLERADGEVVTLEPVDAEVATGDHVRAGMRIGQIARGGHCAERCLHVGVLRNGTYVAPHSVFVAPKVRLRPVGGPRR